LPSASSRRRAARAASALLVDLAERDRQIDAAVFLLRRRLGLRHHGRGLVERALRFVDLALLAQDLRGAQPRLEVGRLAPVHPQVGRDRARLVLLRQRGGAHKERAAAGGQAERGGPLASATAIGR
jgi:hypothetical protein